MGYLARIIAWPLPPAVIGFTHGIAWKMTHLSYSVIVITEILLQARHTGFVDRSLLQNQPSRLL